MTAKEAFELVGQAIPNSKRSNMFGVECYSINRRPFMLFYEEELVCKLFGEVHQEALALEGASLFNPKKNSKPMGNWVQIPFEHFKLWEYYAQLAREFVISNA
ncbi:MAG: hypothetical protein AAGG68_15175 [Bacteroidota bacterium]